MPRDPHREPLPDGAVATELSRRVGDGHEARRAYDRAIALASNGRERAALERRRASLEQS